MNTLIIVDMQNDFIYDSLGTPEAVQAFDKLVDFIDNKNPEFKEYDFRRVCLTRDTHGYDYLSTAEGKNLPVEHTIKGTVGWCVPEKLSRAVYKTFGTIADTMETDRKAIYVDKPTFGFLNWDKVPFLAKCGREDTITLVGVCTDICVISQALILKAMFPDTPIRVIAKFCAGVTPEKHEAALKVMESCQLEVIR